MTATPNTAALTEAEMQALRFLALGPDIMQREIADEGQMCAVLIFSDLERRGMVSRKVAAETITYQLTNIGIEALIAAPVAENEGGV